MQQSPDMCGPAALRSVLLYWGKDVPEAEIARLASFNHEDGTHPSGMAAAARSLGFNALILKDTKLSFVRNQVKKKIPVIVDWFSVDEGHYSVVIGFNKDSVKIMDPEFGKYRILEIDAFQRTWFDFDDSVNHDGLTKRLAIFVWPSHVTLAPGKATRDSDSYCV